MLPYLAPEFSDANSFGPKLRLLYLLVIGGRLGTEPRAMYRVDKCIATWVWVTWPHSVAQAGAVLPASIS